MMTPSDYMVTEPTFNRPFNTVIPLTEETSQVRMAIPTGDVVWYTVGSKTK